jgi:hypothetical protein
MTNLCHTIWLLAALAVALPGCMPQSQNVWLLKQWNVK